MPATFVREVPEATAKIPNGYPANLIKAPGPSTRRRASRTSSSGVGFTFLSQHPDQPFIRTEAIGGRTVLRVRMADRALIAGFGTILTLYAMDAEARAASSEAVTGSNIAVFGFSSSGPAPGSCAGEASICWGDGHGRSIGIP